MTDLTNQQIQALTPVRKSTAPTEGNFKVVAIRNDPHNGIIRGLIYDAYIYKMNAGGQYLRVISAVVPIGYCSPYLSDEDSKDFSLVPKHTTGASHETG